MGFSKDQLLSRLQGLQIDFVKYEHPAALTVEAQAKHIAHMEGGLSKNLFLKDKKHRFYVVSALAETKVDLKVLSQRLGLGKGGLRMAPEDALQEILQVPLGCVTPFALVNESARNVSLLLDQELRSQKCCFFHPLSNAMTISLSACGLDKFLESIGKTPSYVDLQANPSVGRDQPPDLAELVPSDSIVIPDVIEKTVSSRGLTESIVSSGTASRELQPSSSFTDTEKYVEEMLDKTSAILLAEITEESIKQHGEQLGKVVSEKIRKRLCLELKNLSIIFKNTAYTEGFFAGTRHQPKRA